MLLCIHGKADNEIVVDEHFISIFNSQINCYEGFSTGLLDLYFLIYLSCLFFMKYAIAVLFLYIFKQFSHNKIANSNRKSIRRACWPLDHHHYGPLRLLFWCWWKHLRKNKLWMLKYRNWNYNLDYETKLTSGQWSALVDLVINRSTSLRWYLVSNSELELGKCK